MRGKTHAKIDGTTHVVAQTTAVDGARHTHRVVLGCGLAVDVHEAGESRLHRERWCNLRNASCGGCRDYLEHGTLNLAPAHTAARTAEADEATALSCPSCGRQLRRRRDHNYACASGHEFAAPELIGHLTAGFESLLAATKE